MPKIGVTSTNKVYRVTGGCGLAVVMVTSKRNTRGCSNIIAEDRLYGSKRAVATQAARCGC